jgi:UDPglucose 6-dehydrogenase
MKIGICGFGWVGKSMYQMFPEAVVYDKEHPVAVAWMSKFTQKQEQRNLTMKDINECDIAVISVPTPNKEDDSLDTSIVEEVVKECECPLILIRSTVMPGTCDYLEKKYKKNIVFQPEYLGESVNHPLLDEGKNPFMILGGKRENTQKIIEMYQQVYNARTTIRQVSALEAEVIKLSENRAIMFKVAQCQELYDVCEKADIDFNTIREGVYGDDPRFNLWFTFVFPDNRGFHSKCIPKDPKGWCAWAESLGYDPIITKTIIKKNEDWIKLNEVKK